jgi:hypothetical protein
METVNKVKKIWVALVKFISTLWRERRMIASYMFYDDK